MLRYLAINQSLRAVNPFFTVFSFFENKFTLFVEMNTNISTFTLYEQFYIFNVTLLFCRRKKKKNLLQYILFIPFLNLINFLNSRTCETNMHAYMLYHIHYFQIYSPNTSIYIHIYIYIYRLIVFFIALKKYYPSLETNKAA